MHQLAIAANPAMQVPYPPPIISFFPEMARPKNFFVTEDSASLTIRYHPRAPGAAKALVFLILLAWVDLIVTDKPAPLVILLWGGLSLIPLLRLFHRITLTASRSGVTVKSSPALWPGRTRIRREKMRQIFCMREIHRPLRGQPFPVYAVKIMTAGGRTRTLVSGFDGISKARFIEQQLERFLQLPDAEIEGEYGR